MSNKKVTDLIEEVSPTDDDLIYIGDRSQTGTYSDKKLHLQDLKLFVLRNRNNDKNIDYTISSSQCDKRYCTNRFATSTVTFNLPKSDGDLEIGFIVESSKTLSINPDDTDIIYPISSTAGQKISSFVAGNIIYLKSISGGWCIMYKSADWTL